MVTAPPADALPLQRAFEQFAEARGFSCPADLPIGGFWRRTVLRREQLLSPPGALDRILDEIYAFGLALRDGELEAWARKGSPLGDWIEVPAAAWCHLEVLSWSSGVLGVAVRTQVPVTVSVGSGRSQSILKSKTEYDEFFDVRIVSPEEQTNEAPSDSRKASDAAPASIEAVKEWVLANQTFGDRTGPRACEDALKRRVPRSVFRRARVELGLSLPPGRK